jgi:pimeloyl-ACP methyl ester carboxylesterase
MAGPLRGTQRPQPLRRHPRDCQRAKGGTPRGAPASRWGSRAHLGSHNSAVPRVFSDAELRQIRAPVLLLIGDHEVIYKPERAIRRAIRLVAGLKAEIIPKANHNAQYTAPDAVNARILAFLADQESAREEKHIMPG